MSKQKRNEEVDSQAPPQTIRSDNVLWKMNGRDPVLEMFCKYMHDFLSEGSTDAYKSWEQMPEEHRRWLRSVVNKFMGVISTYRMQRAWMVLYNNRPASPQEDVLMVDQEEYSQDIKDNLNKVRRKRHR